MVSLTVVLVAGCSDGGEEPNPLTPTAPGAPGAGSPTDPSLERTGGSLRFGLSNDPRSIDPRFVADEEGSVVVDALFDSLVALDADLEVVPAAASSWEIDDEAREFVFTLREGETFHDGSPVTAADFARSFDRIADGQTNPLSPLSYYLEPISGFAEAQSSGASLRGVEAIDERTLRITLDEPFPEFLQVLAKPELAPLPPAADEDPGGFADSPVGNGPFAMAEPWQRNQFIRVERSETYAGESARLDEVVFRIYANDPAQEIQYAEFAGGQLQFAEVPASKRDEAVEQFGLSTDGYTGPGVLDGLSGTLYYYGFNVERPPFDDPAIRRAVSLSVDRERIAEEITRGTRVPATSIVPPSIPGGRSGACDHCRYDPEEARAIVDAARETEGEEPREFEPVTILHDRGTTHGAIADRIAEDLRTATGLEVEVRAVPLSELLRTARAGEVQIFRLGWQADRPSPGSYLLPLFSSDRIGTENLTRYSVEEVEAMLDVARSARDERERNARYREAEERILEDVAIAPILFYRHNKVVAPGVRGFTYTPLGTVDLARVWLDGR